MIDRFGPTASSYLALVRGACCSMGQVLASARTMAAVWCCSSRRGLFGSGAYAGINVVLASFYPHQLRAIGIGITKSVGRGGNGDRARAHRPRPDGRNGGDARSCPFAARWPCWRRCHVIVIAPTRVVGPERTDPRESAGGLESEEVTRDSADQAVAHPRLLRPGSTRSCWA